MGDRLLNHRVASHRDSHPVCRRVQGHQPLAVTRLDLMLDQDPVLGMEYHTILLDPPQVEEEEHLDHHLDRIQDMGVDPLVLLLDHRLVGEVDHLVPLLTLPQEVVVADRLGHHTVASLALLEQARLVRQAEGVEACRRHALVHLITVDMAPANHLL